MQNEQQLKPLSSPTPGEMRHNDQSDEIEEVLLQVAPVGVLLLTLLVLGAATVLSVIIWPEWPAALATSLSGVEPKAYWYLSRSSAVVAYVLLWASMATGIAITNKMLRVWPGGPTLAALHEWASLLGLVLAMFHALILLGDHYIQYTLDQILIPFASTNYRPLWVGFGQIAMYVLIPVTLSFYVRRWISYKLWRAIHYFSFAVFLLALVHGLMSGTESSLAWVRDMYWASGISLLGLLGYRIALRGSAAQRKPRPQQLPKP